ncbi:MAG: polysaccharide pyruvyl transferase family protein [Leptolyngbyaceae cyanobacterium]
MGHPIQQIVIVHPWHDDNRGDCAILLGMLNVFYQRWPDATISLVSRFSDSDPAASDAYRHTCQAFPQLKVIPSPLWGYSTARHRWRPIEMLLSGAYALLCLVAMPTTASMEQLAQSDLIVMAGGHLRPVSHNQLKSLYLVFRTFYYLFWAQRWGIPYMLWSQSYDLRGLEENNPTTGQSIKPAYSKIRLDARLLAFVLSRAAAVLPREPLSTQALLALNIPDVVTIADSTFCVGSDATAPGLLSNYGLANKRYWAITVKQCSPVADSFLKEMAQLIQHVLASSRADQIVLIAQSIGPTPEEDDRRANCQLLEHLTGSVRNQVTTIEDDLSPTQLSVLYRGAQLVVGTRLQSVILALVAGTPAYAIAYTYPKTHGIMTMMEMASLCTTVEAFSAETALAQIDAADLAHLREQIPMRVSKLKQHTLDVFCRLDMTRSRSNPG